MTKPSRRAPPRGRPARRKKAPAASGGLFSRLVAGGIGAAATAAMVSVPIVAAYFLIGLVPTVVAAIVDRRRPRYLAHTVCGLNVIGLWPFAVGAWKGSLGAADMHRMLLDPKIWLVVYGAAGLGWLLFSVTPVFAEIFLEIRDDRGRHRLERRAAALKEEWGSEVASAEEA
jgi:hypothetical protein